MNTKFIR